MATEVGPSIGIHLDEVRLVVGARPEEGRVCQRPPGPARGHVQADQIRIRHPVETPIKSPGRTDEVGALGPARDVGADRGLRRKRNRIRRIVVAPPEERGQLEVGQVRRKAAHHPVVHPLQRRLEGRHRREVRTLRHAGHPRPPRRIHVHFSAADVAVVVIQRIREVDAVVARPAQVGPRKQIPRPQIQPHHGHVAPLGVGPEEVVAAQIHKRPPCKHRGVSPERRRKIRRPRRAHDVHVPVRAGDDAVRIFHGGSAEVGAVLEGAAVGTEKADAPVELAAERSRGDGPRRGRVGAAARADAGPGEEAAVGVVRGCEAPVVCGGADVRGELEFRVDDERKGGVVRVEGVPDAGAAVGERFEGVAAGDLDELGAVELVCEGRGFDHFTPGSVGTDGVDEGPVRTHPRGSTGVQGRYLRWVGPRCYVEFVLEPVESAGFAAHHPIDARVQPGIPHGAGRVHAARPARRVSPEVVTLGVVGPTGARGRCLRVRPFPRQRPPPCARTVRHCAPRAVGRRRAPPFRGPSRIRQPNSAALEPGPETHFVWPLPPVGREYRPTFLGMRMGRHGTRPLASRPERKHSEPSRPGKGHCPASSHASK